MEQPTVIRHLSAHENLTVPFPGEAYVAILWATDATFHETARINLARALIQSGCRYILCGGVDCEQWHEDADLAFAALEAEADSPLPLVMTTWHHNETLDDVRLFARTCANIDGHHFQNLLVLAVGDSQQRHSHIP